MLYEIVAGERRYRASKLAGCETIPAIIRQLTDLEVLQLQIIENLQRSELHPYEEAQSFKALLENKDAGHWNADELAEKISKSRSYIYASLKLNELCTYAVDQFIDNKFGREIALLIARIPGAKLQEQATKEIISRDLSYRVAKGYIQQTFTLDLSKAPWDKHSSTLYPPAGSCLSCPKRSGNYPELFADIESPDVCTDTACYAAKKVAYAQDLIQHHPKVIHGDQAKEVAPMGAQYYISHGYASNLDQIVIQGHVASDILSDEMPEPHIVIDENHNTREVWNRKEVETILNQRIIDKIAAGELQPSPADKKSPEQIEREQKELEAEKLTEHRQNILNGLTKFWTSDKWTDEQYKKALRNSVSAQPSYAFKFIKIAFNSTQTDQEFIDSLSTKQLSTIFLLLPKMY